ncbi:MAG: heavy metal-associated domain-containing protein [Longimicrobiales bacterium]
MRTKLKITGMHCSGCVSAVERVLARVDGVEEVDISLDAGEAQVTHEDSASVEALVGAVAKAGYSAEAEA